MRKIKPINSITLPIVILLVGILGANFFSLGQTQRSSNELLARLNSSVNRDRTFLRTFALVGNVVDLESQKPIPNASVSIDYVKSGVITDSTGNFYMRLTQGEYILKISAVGYKIFRKYIKLDKDTKMKIELQSVSNMLEEVIVSSVATRKDIQTPSLGVSLLSLKGIKKIPAMMGEVDILRSLQTLPGVSSVGEGSNGINVRGGAVDQNLIYVDDTPIFNPTHLFGLFSIFPSDAIREVELYKGGVPARFGGRTASVLDIKMSEPSLEKGSVQGGIGAISNRLTFETPLIKDKLSLMTSARVSFNDFWFKWFGSPEVRNTRANFYDLASKVFFKPDKKNTISLTAYINHDFYRVDSLFSLENVVANQTDFTYGHQNLALRWNHFFSSKSSLEVSAISSLYKSQTVAPDTANKIDLRNSIRYYNFKAQFSYYPNEKHKINAGISGIRYELEPGILNKDIVSNIAKVILDKEQGYELAAYVDDEYKLSEKLRVQLGLRYVQYLSMGPAPKRVYVAGEPLSGETLLQSTLTSGVIENYGGLEPRLTALYTIDANSSLKLGYNRMHQFLQLVSNNTTPLPTARWKLSDNNIKPQSSDLVSLGYFKNLKESIWELSVETYYRRTQDMIDYISGANLQLNPTIETQLLNGKGLAYGAELMLTKKKGEVTGSIGYTFARSFSKVDGQYPEQRINKGDWYPTNYDKPHTLNLMFNAQPDKHNSFSFNFVYSTGRPLTAPVGTYTLDDQKILVYTSRNNDRIPDYYRLDFSWIISNPSMKTKRWEGSWAFTVYNLLGRSNAYSVFFKTQNDVIRAYRLSVFASPIVSLGYNFKFK